MSLNNQTKKVLQLGLVSLVTAMMVGCSSEPEPQKEPSFACKQEGVLAPKWTCIPNVEGAYTSVGIAQKNPAGMGFMKRVASANGRSALAQQIQTQVKDKVETFTRTTGVGSDQSVDNVLTAVSKQVAKVDLSGSKAIDSWNALSGALYLLMSIPEKNVNTKVKKAILSSAGDKDKLWQQFQAKNALEALDKEFPTK